MVLCMVTVTLAACERPTVKEEPEHALRPALTKLVEGDESPSFHTSTFQYGSEGPILPVGGMTAANWGKWAREAWPKACHRVEVRLVKGRLRENRQCTLEQVSGIEVMQTMRSTGFLEIDGKRVPVVWTWSRFAEKEPASCKNDPAPVGTSEYRLTRSGAFRNWQLAPTDSNYGVPGVINQDEVWDTCGDLRHLLKR